MPYRVSPLLRRDLREEVVGAGEGSREHFRGERLGNLGAEICNWTEGKEERLGEGPEMEAERDFEEMEGRGNLVREDFTPTVAVRAAMDSVRALRVSKIFRN